MPAYRDSYEDGDCFRTKHGEEENEDRRWRARRNEKETDSGGNGFFDGGGAGAGICGIKYHNKEVNHIQTDQCEKIYGKSKQ